MATTKLFGRSACDTSTVTICSDDSCKKDHCKICRRHLCPVCGGHYMTMIHAGDIQGCCEACVKITKGDKSGIYASHPDAGFSELALVLGFLLAFFVIVLIGTITDNAATAKMGTACVENGGQWIYDEHKSAFECKRP